MKDKNKKFQSFTSSVILEIKARKFPNTCKYLFMSYSFFQTGNN